MEQTLPSANSTPGFVPALTHFTDAIDAFPKELIKHFSMFKEVEAKIHDPEQVLQILLEEIARQPVPTIAQRRNPPQSHIGLIRDNSMNGSVNGSIHQDSASRHQQLSVDLFPEKFDSLAPEEQAELRKRQLFFRLRMVIAAMLPTLDEKLVVLTAAKNTKDKGLNRMNTSYPHINSEISEEARYGNPNHWAYADKEEKKKGGTSNERSRREVASANNLAAAAAAVHEGDAAALRSEARREAMMANKRSRNVHLDSDFDDARPAKKTQTKARKVAMEATSTSESKAYGLGISSNGTSQQIKRKRVDKTASAAPAMERSLSNALNNVGAGGRTGVSPIATPGAEAGRKKVRAAPAPVQPRKRSAVVAAHSPPMASSPLASTFVTSREVIAAAQRPQSSRARQNSNTNSINSAIQETSRGRRPSSSQSNRPTNESNVIQELEQAAGISRVPHTAKEGYVPNDTSEVTNTVDPAAFKSEELDAQDNETPETDHPLPIPITTRAGRASKTATPIGSSFPEVPMVRSRSTRNANNGGSHASSETTGSGTQNKRSHKKGASTTQAIIPAPTIEPEDDGSSPAAELSDEAGEDVDELRYCYCNEVSYGGMIACDNDECPREWFHLACVNMDKAPNARTKWFCSDECKENYNVRKEKKSRPGSRQ